jgi:hypothetical protein
VAVICGTPPQQTRRRRGTVLHSENVKSVIRESALYKLLISQVPNLMSISRCFCHFPKSLSKSEAHMNLS